MKKFICFLLLIICSFTFTGCLNKNELNSLGIVLGLGIDKDKDNKYEVTIETIDPNTQENTDGASKESGYILHSAKGNSIFEASRNVSKDASRKNYWPHTNLVVLSQDVATDNIRPVIDFFTRDAQRRRTAYLVLTKSNIKSLLSSNTDYDNISSKEITNLIEEFSINGLGVKNDIREFITQCEDVTGVSLINCFKLNPNPKNSDNILDSVGIIYKYKLVDFISLEENRLINFFKNNIKSTVLTFKNDDSTITLEVTKSKTKYKPIIKNNQYILNSNTNIYCNVVEYSSNTELNTLDRNKLNKIVSKSMRNSLITLFNKSKTIYGLDLFGFGNIFSYKYPYLLNISQDEWQKIFVDKIIFNPNINVDINFTGIKN